MASYLGPYLGPPSSIESVSQLIGPPGQEDTPVDTPIYTLPYPDITVSIEGFYKVFVQENYIGKWYTFKEAAEAHDVRKIELFGNDATIYLPTPSDEIVEPPNTIKTISIIKPKVQIATKIEDHLTLAVSLICPSITYPNYYGLRYLHKKLDKKLSRLAGPKDDLLDYCLELAIISYFSLITRAKKDNGNNAVEGAGEMGIRRERLGPQRQDAVISF